MTRPALPIHDALPELRSALAAHSSAVLVAPPGAGKTTRAPGGATRTALECVASAERSSGSASSIGKAVRVMRLLRKRHRREQALGRGPWRRRAALLIGVAFLESQRM